MFERVGSSGIFSQSTDTDGEAYTPLENHPCSQVVIYNQTGVALRVAYRATDGNPPTGQTYLPVPDQTAQPLRGITNSNQVMVKRADESDTPVAFYYVVEG